MKFFNNLVVALLLPVLSHQKSNATSETYIGAVAEYSPVYGDENNKQNVENYLKFIKKADEYGADILVFPESSLSIPMSGNKSESRTEATSYIPDPEDKIAPCSNNFYAQTLQNISCAAKKYKMYIVINHQEKVDCKNNCPQDGFLVYNTNVVFDKKGVVIARYRKYNLFYEFGTNITSEAIPSYFTTDFNVTFGQFICFDILFQTPTLNLTRNLGITDIVYSTNWVSVLPFAFSFEAQAAWAYANDVNFLAAGLNNPKTASGGTGIYIGKKGYVSASVNDKASNILMVAEIPKFKDGRRLRNINLTSLHVYEFDNSEISTTETNGTGKLLYKTNDIHQYSTELVNFEETIFNKTICDHDLCCEFQLELEHNKNDIIPGSSYYRYRLVAFNGTMSFIGAATSGAKICGIISCVDDTIDGCGHLHNSNKPISRPTNFKHASVKMFDKNNENFFTPTTLTGTMLPLNVTDFSFKKVANDKSSYYHLTLTQPRKDLLTFSVLGRNFELDGSEVTPSSSAKPSISCLLIIVLMATIINYV